MSKFFLLLFLGTLSVSSIFAAPPVNDARINSTQLASSRRVFLNKETITGATDDIEFLRSFEQSVWYKWTAPSSGTVNLQFLSGFVTFPSVFDEDGHLISSSNSASSYDGGPWDKKFSFDAEFGQTYYMVVEPNGSDTNYTSDLFGFVLIQELGEFPDNLANAASLNDVGNATVIEGTSFAATTETGEPVHAGVSNAKSVWLKWTATQHSTVTVDTTGSSFDTVLAVYQVSIVGPLVNYTEVKSNDDISAGFSPIRQSKVSFVADTNATYYFAVAGKNGAAGRVFITFDVTPRKPDFAVLPTSVYVQNNTVATLVAPANGTGTITYKWQRMPAGSTTWSDLANVSPYSGTTTSTLTVTNALAAMSGDQFRVSATDSVGTTVSKGVKLVVTDFAPMETTVGEIINFDLTNGTPPATGTTYKTGKLPAGLVLNPVTGQITGSPTAKPGSYIVEYWTVTGKVQGPHKFLLVGVEPFPSALTGSFEALLEDPSAPYLPTGKLEITVTSTGAFTGRLTAKDTKVYSLKGIFKLSNLAPTSIASVQIKATPALTINLSVSSGQVLSASVFPTATPSNVIGVSTSGVRVTTFAKGQAPLWARNYTLAIAPQVNLDSADPDRNAPTGAAYAVAKIMPTGALSLKGKTADGKALTALLASTPTLTGTNTFRLYANPYKISGAYLAGWLRLQPSGSIYRILDGDDMYWNLPANGIKSYAYNAGFGPIALNANMEEWVTPSASKPLNSVLNLLSAPATYGITLSGAGIADINTSFAVSTANKITASSSQLKLKFTPTTGLLTGTYLIPGTPARTATFEGVFLPKNDSAGSRPVIQGFFSLPGVSVKTPQFGNLTETPAPPIIETPAP